MYTRNDKINDFERPTADGATFRLSDYRGKTLLVVFLRHLA